MWKFKCECGKKNSDKLILLKFGVGKRGVDDIVWFDCLCPACGQECRHTVKLWLLCGAKSILEARLEN